MSWNSCLCVLLSCSWIVFSIRSTLGSWGAGQECPRDYLEGPSRRCSDSLHAVLDEIQTSDQLISAELRLNKTCREWDRANACYQQLMLKCSQDPIAIHHLRLHIGKYIIYSVPCSRRNTITIMPNHSLGECIMSELSTTHTCTDAIETYLKHFITNRNYRGACRVVSSVLRCLHDVRSMIESRCGAEGSSEYTRHFIKPVVDQTRNVVISHCSLTSPYSDYFMAPLSTSGSFPLQYNFFLVVFACIALSLHLSPCTGIFVELLPRPKRASDLIGVFNFSFFIDFIACFVMFASKLLQSCTSPFVRSIPPTTRQMSRSCLGLSFAPLKPSSSAKLHSNEVSDCLTSQASSPLERKSFSNLKRVAHFSWKRQIPSRIKNYGRQRRISSRRHASNFRQTASSLLMIFQGRLLEICLKRRLPPRKRKENPSISSCLSATKSIQYFSSYFIGSQAYSSVVPVVSCGSVSSSTKKFRATSTRSQSFNARRTGG